jgi:hypothetical protein
VVDREIEGIGGGERGPLRRTLMRWRLVAVDSHSLKRSELHMGSLIPFHAILSLPTSFVTTFAIYPLVKGGVPRSGDAVVRLTPRRVRQR